MQLFARETPKDRRSRYIQQQKDWKPGDDERLLSYTEENVRKALYYFERNLKSGLKAPDGAEINVTEDDFFKLIKDFRLLKKPEWIKEIILNASVKLKQRDGRYVYFSYNPPGYVATGEITYSSHYFGIGGKESVSEMIESKLRKGGKIVWEQI